MKKKTVYWIVGSLIGLLLLLIIFGRGGEEGTKVAVEAAAAHTITETVTASGKIYPETEVKISPEASGEITLLTVAEGDSVRKGQLLARINPAMYSSAVNQAAAAVQQNRAGAVNSQELVAQARAQFEQAQQAYNRNKKLFDDKVISAQEFEQAEVSFKTARASYDAARASASGSQYGVQGAVASLSQAQASLQKTTIVAPVNGIISALNVKLGERVVGTAQMAGTEMLTIADMSRIEVRVDVSETDIAKVKIGDTAVVEADAYRTRKLTGVVSKVSVSGARGAGAAAATSSSDGVTNYTVHILILPSSYADLQASGGPQRRIPFKPGMSATVDIQTRRERGVLGVPVNAVTTRDWPDSLKEKRRTSGSDEDDIRQVVFVHDKTKKEVTMRDVKTGIQDNTYIRIIDGLKAGEEVVVAPYGAIARLLKDKSKVRVVKKEQLFEEAKEED